MSIETRMAKEAQIESDRSVTHDEIHEMFMDVVNIVEPDHPYKDDPYPINISDIERGYKQSRSSLYASCGPRKHDKVVFFSADKGSFEDWCLERWLAIFTHECTHIKVGSHTNQESGSHPPRFWREFGFNAHLVLDEWDTLQNTYGSIDRKKYIGKIVKNEVNSFNIDRRYGDVDMRRQEMARWFESRLKRV